MRKAIDNYYTPEILADKLASLVIEKDIHSAVDFCVGDGDLLKAVQRRFPDVECYGTDIEKDAIAALKVSQPSWTLDVCDFSKTEVFDSLPLLGDRKYDLIVLNPPFTCKGSTICKIEFEGKSYHVSTAMVFVTNALKYRSENGVLYAILPSSCAYSIKDRSLWNYLVQEYNLQILDTPDRMYWQECAANIIIVSIGGKEKRQTAVREEYDFTTLPIDTIVRGHISPHEANYVNGKKGVKYIHTTNMQENMIVNCARVSIPKNRDVVRFGEVSFRGPAVLIPRVCHPNIGKICIYKDKTAFVPSDCVIALCAQNVEDATIIANTIKEHWAQFRTIYQGTAAKYTTMERVQKLFGKA